LARIIALDVGTKTIGVAMSDELKMLASPCFTVARKGVRQDVAKLVDYMADFDIERIVVGLPLELDGTEERSARLARQVGEALAEATSLPMTYIDERFTSVEAERQLIAAGKRRKKRKQVIDQQAAVLILRSYLEHGDWSQLGGSLS